MELTIVKNEKDNLDIIFEALSHKHRREIINILSLQPCSISKLASLRYLSLPAIHKHIKVLEKANMIQRKKIGRTNFISLNSKSLKQLQSWVMKFQTYWDSEIKTYENYLSYLSDDNKDKKET